MKQVKVQFEGKEKTVEGTEAAEIASGVLAFAKEHGLKRFIVKDVDGKPVSTKDVSEKQKVELFRTEVAG